MELCDPPVGLGGVTEELVEGISVECCRRDLCSPAFGKSKFILPGGPNASEPVEPELSDPLQE